MSYLLEKLTITKLEIGLPASSKTLPYSTSERPLMKKITYTYDSMNRRVARTDEKGTTQYLYGNPNHPFQLTAVRSPLGSLSRYHYDDFGLLFALERDNNWYYITTDQLGTPRVVCDANGEVVKVLEYDSFGQVIADSNPAFELHISFAGGLADGDTELVRFGFRDYHSASGKWTAKDPIGFAGGDTNIYSYVLNNPVNFIDSQGLSPSLQQCLLDCTLDQYGAKELFYAGTGAVVAGQELIPKWLVTGRDIVPEGASSGTSVASYGFSQLAKKCGIKNLPKRLWAPTAKNLLATTSNIGRLAGRWTPIVGWGLLAVDGVTIGICTNKCTQATSSSN